MTDEEALDDYIVWQLCKKQENIQRKIIEGSIDGEMLKREIIEKVRQEYRGKDYSYEEKLDLLQELDSNLQYRLEMFEGHSWRK